MRVSDHYNLGRTQPTLDFVDVDVKNDLPVFLDPRALRLLRSEWGAECVSLTQDFFRRVLHLIRERDDVGGGQMLRTLREPNETHLGLSRGRSRGRAMGYRSSDDVWNALRESQAVHTGLIEDLEDTILMVEGIADDIVSDITTNIIREPLIRYTQDACRAYGIHLVPDIDSGPLWDPAQHQWYSEFTDLPVVADRKLLLVPKAIVRRKMDYDAEEYYQHYILEHLREVELSANSELVQLLRTGPRVTKRDLEAKYGRGKAVILRQTLNHPELLRRYRADKGQHIRPPLGHVEIADQEGSAPPDWDALLNAAISQPVGNDHADDYQRAIEALLSALFYPSLVSPQYEHKIHEGRKRIDITFTNVATTGFFAWLADHYCAPYVYVECKNYGRDLANPELDQLSGRFSPSRGVFGLPICRSFDDKNLFIQRCRDTAADQRGFVLPLDDEDLRVLVEARRADDQATQFQFLQERFQRLVM